MGFFDMLIALQLESYVRSVEVSQNECILPIGADLCSEGDKKNSMKIPQAHSHFSHPYNFFVFAGTGVTGGLEQ